MPKIAAIAAAVVLVIGGGVAAAVVATSGDSSTGAQGADTTGDDTSTPSPTPTPEPTPTPTTDAATLSPDEAAKQLVITARDLDALGYGDWTSSRGNPSVNANVGFCNKQLASGPSQFSQREHFFSINGPATFPQLITAGAVFPDAAAAQSYMSQRNRSASCGIWNVGVISLSVTEPPIAPLLPGCQCQDVAVHEVDAVDQNGQSQRQFTILAEQDRYIAAAFYTVPDGFTTDGQLADFIGFLIDRVVAQVNDVTIRSLGDVDG